LSESKGNLPGGGFFVKDGTDFHFDEKFDAVFSNATLHWIKNADAPLNVFTMPLNPAVALWPKWAAKAMCSN
jgi:trans-aconitate methyltransferase